MVRGDTERVPLNSNQIQPSQWWRGAPSTQAALVSRSQWDGRVGRTYMVVASPGGKVWVSSEKVT